MNLAATGQALGLNIAAITVLAYAIYYRRHRRKDLLGAYVALNLGVFCAVTLLATQTVSVGMAFGLFGILSIVRLRSGSISQGEVGYYFVALTLGLVNGLAVGGFAVSVLLNGVLLVGMLIADHPRLAARVERCSVLIDTVYGERELLHADLARRLNGRVLRCEVTDVDYVAATTRCDVRYRRSQRPAPVGEIAGSPRPGSAVERVDGSHTAGARAPLPA